MTQQRHIHVGKIEQAAASRKPGYREAIQRVSQPDPRHPGYVLMSEADYQAVRRAFALAPPSPRPAPRLRPPEASGGVRLGDALHKVLGPIGRAINWPCMKGDGTTDVRPGSPCDKRIQALNKVKI